MVVMMANNLLTCF
jgi:hypothetical protein